MELCHEKLYLYSMVNDMLNSYLLGPTLQETLAPPALNDRFRLISSDPNQVRQSASFKFTYAACTHWPDPKRRSVPIHRWSAMRMLRSPLLWLPFQVCDRSLPNTSMLFHVVTSS
jgi:hypothetical protein